MRLQEEIHQVRDLQYLLALPGCLPPHKRGELGATYAEVMSIRLVLRGNGALLVAVQDLALSHHLLLIAAGTSNPRGLPSPASKYAVGQPSNGWP